MTVTYPSPRWSPGLAAAWHKKQPWIVGCNFLPSYAVNFVDMWHHSSFDLAAIDRELGWAAHVGMNAIRVNLQYLQWMDDPAQQAQNFTRFLDTAARHQIRVVPCLFDDCGFSGDDANADPQPAPRPGVHNGRALASPGREIVMDRTQWPTCLDYLRDVMTRFGDHPNVLFWDLYNEPGNGAVFVSYMETIDISDSLLASSLDLLIQVFDAAQEIDPIHPLTSGAWRHRNFDDATAHAHQPYQNTIDQVMLAMSDVVSFHGYVDVDRMGELISYLKLFGRPIFCTEWMARNADSRILDQLPLLRQQNVGALQWGLVQGRTQTHLPWPHVNAKLKKKAGEELEWFHDLLRPDGTPYNVAEVDTIKRLTTQP